MSGFPNRASRLDYGPEPIDRRPVTDPEKELGAGIGRLMFYQLAGCGIMVPVAWCHLTAAAVIVSRAESWNPDAKTGAPYTAPTLTHPGAGQYTIEWAAQYPDHDQVSLRTLNFKWAAAFVQGSGDYTASAAVVNPHKIGIWTRSAGALADLPFAAAVW